MTADEYVPSDEDVRESYVTGKIRDGYGVDWDDLEPGAVMDFDAWLAAHDARVRRTAAREALDGIADDIALWEGEYTGATIARRIRHHRNTHHSEETP